MNFSDELKIGAMTILALALGILGFYYLKGVPLKKTQRVFVLLDDAARVSPASPVAMHGIRIGKVSTVVQDLNVIGKDTFNVVFMLNIDKTSNVPSNSTVEIVELDLLGNKELRIVPVKSSRYISTGDTIVGSVSGGLVQVLKQELTDKLDPILARTQPLLESIDTLINSVNNSLNGEGEGNLDDMFGNLSKSLKNLEKITVKVDVLMANQSQNIEDMMVDAKKITGSLANNTEEIDSIIGNFNTLSGKLSKIEFESLLSSASESIDQVKKLMTELNDGDGTLHKLLYEDDIYNGLDSTLLAINALLEDLKANPKRYVSFSLIARKDKSGKNDTE